MHTLVSWCLFEFIHFYFILLVVQIAVETLSNSVCYVRKLFDSAFIYQPTEQFSISFAYEGAFVRFMVWLKRLFLGSGHVLTVVAPAAYAMNILHN